MSKSNKSPVPYSKLPKKQKRLLDQAARGDWGEIKPVTRALPDKTKYSRSRNKNSLTRTGAYPPSEQGSFYVYSVG